MAFSENLANETLETPRRGPARKEKVEPMNYWVRGASKWLPMVVTVVVLLWALGLLVDRKTFENVAPVEPLDSLPSKEESSVAETPSDEPRSLPKSLLLPLRLGLILFVCLFSGMGCGTAMLSDENLAKRAKRDFNRMKGKETLSTNASHNKMIKEIGERIAGVAGTFTEPIPRRISAVRQACCQARCESLRKPHPPDQSLYREENDRKCIDSKEPQHEPTLHL